MANHKSMKWNMLDLAEVDVGTQNTFANSSFVDNVAASACPKGKCKEDLACHKESSDQSTKTLQQMQFEKMADLSNSDLSKLLRQEFEKHAEQLKDQCLFCDSTQPHKRNATCKTYKPSTEKVAEDHDAFQGVQASRDLCKYCCSSKFFDVADDLVCIACNKSQATGDLIPIDKMVFQILPGPLMKPTDQNQSSDQEKEINKGIPAVVENQSCGSYMAKYFDGPQSTSLVQKDGTHEDISIQMLSTNYHKVKLV